MHHPFLILFCPVPHIDYINLQEYKFFRFDWFSYTELAAISYTYRFR